MKTALRVLAPLLLLGILLPQSGLAHEPHGVGDAGSAPIAPTSVAQNDQFGLCFVSSAEAHASSARYARAVSAGAGWTRWPIYWGNVETIPSIYNYSSQDPVVRDDLAHGLKISAILLGTPGFYATGGLAGVHLPRFGDRRTQARDDPDRESVSMASSVPEGLRTPVFSDGTDTPGPGKTIHPDNHWAQFVYRTVSRYKPGGAFGAGVSVWEVWNEPDYHFFWSGSVQDYYRLLQVAYVTVKFADPSAKVLIGGLAIYMSPTWLDSLLDAMASDPNGVARQLNHSYFDVLPIHVYSTSAETLAQTQRVQAALAAHGLSDKPLWINESGVPVWNDYPGPTWDPHSAYRATLDEQAAYVLQNAALALYSGVEKVFHFQLYDDCGNSPPGTNDVGDAFGLLRNPATADCFHSHPQPDTPRPALTAFQLATSLLNGARPLWRKTSAGAQQVGFYRPAAGERVVVLWATGGSAATVAVRAVASQGTLTNQLGQTQVLIPLGGTHTISLPAATNRNNPALAGYMIGGQTLLLVERDTSPPDTSVYPLPPNSLTDFTVYWHGTDEGSGVASFDVFLSTDGGALTLWKVATTATNAPFRGVIGHRYGFCVRGTDNAGNVGSVPTDPQTETTVTNVPTVTPSPTEGPGVFVSGSVANSLGVGVAGAEVRLMNWLGQVSSVWSDSLGRWQAGPLPGGSYEVTASASGYGVWNAPQRLSFPGDSSGIVLNLPPRNNAVVNGDLELGLDGWTLGGSTQAVADSDAFDGTKALALGKDFQGEPALNGGGNATVYQTIAVPSGAAPAALSFMYKITSAEAVQGHDWFEALVIDGGAATYLIAPRSVWQSTGGWRHLSVDLSPWKGRSVLFALNVYQDSADRPTVALVDEISIGLTGPAGDTATPTRTSVLGWTATRTPTRSRTPSPSPTSSRTPTGSSTPTPSGTATASSTARPTLTGTATRTPNWTPTGPARTPTATPSPPARTATPTRGSQANLVARPAVLRYDQTVRLEGRGWQPGTPLLVELHRPTPGTILTWLVPGADGAFQWEWTPSSAEPVGVYTVFAYSVNGDRANTWFTVLGQGTPAAATRRRWLPVILASD